MGHTLRFDETHVRKSGHVAPGSTSLRSGRDDKVFWGLGDVDLTSVVRAGIDMKCLLVTYLQKVRQSNATRTLVCVSEKVCY
jgi:hypothetical protein